MPFFAMLAAAVLLTLTQARGSEAKVCSLAQCADALRARHEAAASVVARLRVSLHDRAKNKDFELNGAYLRDAAGNLRFRVTAETGQLVLDMGVHGEKVELCIPGKQLYLEGTREALLDHPRCQLALLAHCGLDLFFPAAPPNMRSQRAVCSLNGRGYFNVPEPQSILPRYSMRLTVDESNCVVDQKRIYARGSTDAGHVIYSRYRFPETAMPPVKPAYPGHVSLHVPGDAFVLDLDVEDLTVNTPIAPAKFAIPVPAGFKREPLAAALERDTNVWDQ